MGPPFELEVVRLRRRLLVLLVLRVGDRRRHRVILLGADDEERRPLAVLEVKLRRRVEMEVGEAGLVQDLPGLGDGISLVCRGGILWAERVHEAVRELLERQRDDTVPLRRMREHRRCGP